jgi:tRNA-binding protein
MTQIEWQDFEKVDLRVGTIVSAAEFPEARRPAYKLEVDFGDDIGRLRASAQITDLYQPDDLIGKQVLGVVNFPPKQIGPFMSQCQDGGEVILAVPDRPARNGDRLA